MNLRPYHGEDCRSVVQLLNICFPEKNITEKSFVWKHFDPYFQKLSRAFVAWEGQTAVSFVCFVPSVVTKGTEIIHFYSCAIAATHPDFRRRGLVTKLTKRVEDTLGKDTNYYGFSNESGVLIDRYSKHIPYHIVDQLTKSYIPASPISGDYTARVVAEIPVSFFSTCANVHFHIQKDASYIWWRYAAHPKQRYVYMQMSDKEKIIGYVVVKETRFRFELYDILADNDPIIFQNMIRTMQHVAFHNKKAMCTVVCLPNMFWKRVFAMPHITRPIEIYFTIKSQRTLNNPEDWIIMGG